MRISLLLPVSIALVVIIVEGHAQPLNYGPSASPLSWKALRPEQPIKEAEFSLSRGRLGDVPEHPMSLQLADLKDGRPYGDKEERRVILARFEPVLVRAPEDKSPASITLTVACDAATKELVCAFTDPSPRWIVSTLDPGVVDSSAIDDGWEMSPARYDSLKSSLTDVLAAAWRTFGVDPSKTGQVIIRPRFVANKYPAEQGTLVPRYRPCNVWIVEMLGTEIIKHRVFGADHNLTTLVAQFRDGDLTQLPSRVLP